MTTKREVIAEGLILSTTPDKPGHLCVTVHDPDLSRHPRFQILTPEEVDKLVLSALIMTKPEDLDPIAAEDYQVARDAVRMWQGTRATREGERQREAERDAVMKEAGYNLLTYTEAGPALRNLVDHLIEARRASSNRPR